MTDRDGYKSVDYAAVTPILVEAIKAQQRKIDSQQREIDEAHRAIFARLRSGKSDGRGAHAHQEFWHCLHWMIHAAVNALASKKVMPAKISSWALVID